MDPLDDVLTRLARIEAVLLDMRDQTVVRAWYSVEEFAAAVGLSPFTVREHCRLGRLRGVKKWSGRGKHQSWALCHDELERYRREGLLPLDAGPRGPGSCDLSGPRSAGANHRRMTGTSPSR